MSEDKTKIPKKTRVAEKKTIQESDPSGADIVSLEDFQKRRLHNESLRLLSYADQIDAIITGAVANRHDLLDIAGVLAHRLGTLIGQLPEGDREVLHSVCIKVLTKQAQIH